MPVQGALTFRRRGLGLQGIDEQLVSPGYVLYSPLTSNTAHLVSTSGKEVHRWTLPYRVGRYARILPESSLAYNGVHPDAPRLFPMWAKYRGGMMIQLDSNGKILRQYSDPYAHHDQNHLDDGTILYTTLEPLTPAEAARVQGGIPGSEAPGGIIHADCIKLVRPWSASTISPSADFEGEGKGGAKLLWSWRAIEHLDSEAFAAHAHHPREHWPLIKEKEVKWEYEDTSTGGLGFFTPFMGSAQKLGNRNVLICEAATGRIFEVTEGGILVWEFVVPQLQDYKMVMAAEEREEMERNGFSNQSNAVFRAYKYTPKELEWLKGGFFYSNGQCIDFSILTWTVLSSVI
ncbi:uncharacterized protein N7477_004634 [Penicillium maclennaniae]|uniref:uncharacterized protein n=1 Tax=Penicillium maclennaniae TaxID=1343394 RepID=UPI00254245C9|nr:uncharacterized protein N7477_004634 [Penicillium maclennaniae]KAJ5674700.1 hypothetical protein N7477_004634 [Penicillium maclennaniae]